MSEIVLEAREIQFVRGKREILNVERFSLGAGETVALIGPNGAGKSTLLQVLALLLKPDRGVVAFRGAPANGKNALALRRRMAVVFQEPLLLNTTVFGNVAAGLKLRGTPGGEIAPRVNTWLKRLGIERLARRRAQQLSGGEAQRVSLARAFALEPEVLFLDEPFSALDFPTRLGLLRDLGGLLQETGLTTVFVTHDFSEVPYLTDRVAMMKNGRLARLGTFEEVFKVKPRKETYLTSLYRVFDEDSGPDGRPGTGQGSAKQVT